MKYTGTGMTTAMQLARLFEAGQTTLNHIKQNKYQKNETLYKYISTIIYLKGFSVFFLRKIIWGIPFQILTPTREKAFRSTLSRDSVVWMFRSWGTCIVSMNARNSREEFQNIIRRNVFV